MLTKIVSQKSLVFLTIISFLVLFSLAATFVTPVHADVSITVTAADTLLDNPPPTSGTTPTPTPVPVPDPTPLPPLIPTLPPYIGMRCSGPMDCGMHLTCANNKCVECVMDRQCLTGYICLQNTCMLSSVTPVDPIEELPTPITPPGPNQPPDNDDGEDNGDDGDEEPSGEVPPESCNTTPICINQHPNVVCDDDNNCSCRQGWGGVDDQYCLERVPYLDQGDVCRCVEGWECSPNGQSCQCTSSYGGPNCSSSGYCLYIADYPRFQAGESDNDIIVDLCDTNSSCQQDMKTCKCNLGYGPNPNNLIDPAQDNASSPDCSQEVCFELHTGALSCLDYKNKHCPMGSKSGDLCVCRPGRTGDDCNLPLCDSSSCNGPNKECVGNFCQCQVGWMMSRDGTCTKPICYSSPSNPDIKQCPGNRICTDQGLCDCQNGWRGMNCDVIIQDTNCPNGD